MGTAAVTADTATVTETRVAERRTTGGRRSNTPAKESRPSLVRGNGRQAFRGNGRQAFRGNHGQGGYYESDQRYSNGRGGYAERDQYWGRNGGYAEFDSWSNNGRGNGRGYGSGYG